MVCWIGDAILLSIGCSLHVVKVFWGELRLSLNVGTENRRKEVCLGNGLVITTQPHNILPK
jgi:hypothetical protein